MTTRVARCPECRAESDPGSDFCVACGAYLAWSDPASGDDRDSSPEPDSPGPSRDATRSTGSALLLLRVAGLDVGDPEAAKALRVAAGSTLALTATVRNESGIVDTFTVAVEGLPESWVDVLPDASNLLPTGSHGSFEREVAITISPPRSSAASAGPWPFAVTVRSFSRATEDARVEAVLTVEPFAALEVEARPTVGAGRRGAFFACDVRNAGNRQADVEVRALAPDQGCTFELPAALRIAAGQVAPVPVRVRPVKPLWVGRPADHPVQVEALEAELPAPVKAPPVVYRQRPWIPWWLPPLAMLLAVAAIALYFALPRKATMPALIGDRGAFAAQRELARAGLRTHPQVKLKILRRVAAGTVVGQVPRAGSRVPASTPVTIEVAAGPATTIVPDLTGLRPATADAVLARVHLTLGAVSPSLDPKARIKSQLPAPGAVRKQGTPVEVVLAARTVKVPDIRGRTPPAAEKRLRRAGLLLGSVQPKLSNHARVASQLPAPGVRRPRGTPVDVVVARRRVLVPDLSGMTVQGADRALTICMLKLGPLPPDIAPGQRVRGQVPARDAHRPPGTLVTVILGPKPKRRPAGLPKRQECRPK